MNFKRTPTRWLTIGILLSAFPALAQQKFTISGTITDGKTGEALIGATVIANEKSGVGANEYGFYSLSLPKGTYTFKASYVGYQPSEKLITLDGSIVVNFYLEETNVLNEVVISSKRQNDNLTEAKMGTETLNMKEIGKIPVIFGEKDIVKTISLLPGIKSAGEGSNGFSVRGGATDQNLILLDE